MTFSPRIRAIMPPAISIPGSGAEAETGKKVAKPAAGDHPVLGAWRAIFTTADLLGCCGSERLDTSDFFGVPHKNFHIHLPTMRGRQVDPA